MSGFSPELLTFLSDLSEHNDRDWFQANRVRYESLVREASLAFIEDLRPRFQALSPHIRCDDRALFRIYRDTRFSKDKRPYKTHVGLHFRHELTASDVHTPGLYLHIEPGASMFGCGIWQPDPPTLAKLRKRVHDDVVGWQRVIDTIAPTGMTWEGDQLVRPPRGVAPDHPHVDQLRRKSYILLQRVDDEVITSDRALEAFASTCEGAAPLMADLCRTLDLPW